MNKVGFCEMVSRLKVRRDEGVLKQVEETEEMEMLSTIWLERILLVMFKCE